mgnify:CR=1 FL=1
MDKLDTMQLIALAAALGWASGIRLYAVLFIVGAVGFAGWFEIPEHLRVLSHPLVLGASGFMVVAEFFADKIPGFDSVWDLVHTFDSHSGRGRACGKRLRRFAAGMDAGLRHPRRDAGGREPLHQGRCSPGDQHLARTGIELGGVVWRGLAGRRAALSRARAPGRAADRAGAADRTFGVAAAQAVALHSGHVGANFAGMALDCAAPRPTVRRRKNQPMFDRILIANRGEIACRVARTARRMGIRAIAVYSDADADALHVAACDEAHRLGPAPPRESYLRTDRIIEIAVAAGAQAIHPGYGFLSENEAFAAAVAAAGIVFVGPPPAAIRAMGSKSESKRIMAKAGVRLVPGYHGAGQDDALLAREADSIGYPVLIKASAGGGGKGMRVVERQADFAAALASARREAKAGFGDDRMLLEKYLDEPRHIEMQVFADTHGQCVHLFERDCSVQRRHQKILEEAPAPGMTRERRSEMGLAAVVAAQAIGYVGAGTVEFIVDKTGLFHFMEMNTRLQVEHPVTEMITGLDLVEWQLRVAAGEALPLSQASAGFLRARHRGAHLRRGPRARLPALDRAHRLPRGAPESDSVRIDTGVRAGDEISQYYDPMIAKLVAWGEDRASALRRLRRALASYHVAGVTTNISFLQRVVAHPAFAEARLDTGLISPSPRGIVCAASAAFTASAGCHRHRRVPAAPGRGGAASAGVRGPLFALARYRSVVAQLGRARDFAQLLGTWPDAWCAFASDRRRSSGQHRQRRGHGGCGSDGER